MADVHVAAWREQHRQALFDGASPDRHITQMVIDDAKHFSPEERERIVASYPPHEREARTKGVPTMGSGRIFSTAEEKLLVEPHEVPSHWLRWGGCDFGWTHHTAFCELAWDRDLDIVYLVRTLRLREQTPLQHAEAVRPWKLQWAWPMDGRRREAGRCGDFATGLDMMFTHAQFDDGTVSVEAGLMQMADRMRGGRWKVFKGQNDGWMEEYRLYHRDGDGRVVDENDDAISTSRYGLMMRRFGRTADFKFYQPIQYPKLGIV
jgi:hypothetical protein